MMDQAADYCVAWSLTQYEFHQIQDEVKKIAQEVRSLALRGY